MAVAVAAVVEPGRHLLVGLLQQFREFAARGFEEFGALGVGFVGLGLQLEILEDTQTHVAYVGGTNKQVIFPTKES